MNRQQISALPPMTGLVAGTQAQSKIISNKRTGFFVYTLECAVTLAGGVAATIKNGGSCAALLNFMGLSDAGDDRAYWPWYAMLALTQRVVYSGAFGLGATPNLRLNSLADGVYPLRETIVLPFAWPGPQGSSAPWETPHIQPDPKQDSWMWVIPNLDVTNIVDAGGTLSTPLTVRCTQIYDSEVGRLPFMLPKFENVITQPVPGAATLPLYIRKSDPQRGFVIASLDSNDGVVSDIIQQCRLYDNADDGMYIGPTSIRWTDLLRWEAMKIGTPPFLGNSLATGIPGAMDGFGTYFHNWQDSGRLSNIYNPRNAGTDLQFEVTALPSVVGGGTATVTASVITMQQIPGRTQIPIGPNGRPIFTF